MPSASRFRLSLLLGFLLVGASVAAETAKPDAIVVMAGDLHSAYERMPQFVGCVDRLHAENPGVPLSILIDGDTFELGNAVARRTGGALEFALFSALAKRAPTILNLGNHEAEFCDMAETVARVQAAGVVVIGGNLRDPATGKHYAPASTPLKLGGREAIVVGFVTDRLSTFRAAVRPSLELMDPVAWGRQTLPGLLRAAAVPIVLSHAGLRADRELLPLAPDGTLFVGAHDHLRFVHREGRTVYVHSGCWAEFVSIARLRFVDGVPHWDVEQVPLTADAPSDADFAALVRETFARELTPEEKSVIGRAPRALPPSEAARFAVEAARRAAQADVAIVGGTTFGAGLPAGDVTRFAFDACVRFDGPLCVGEIDGAALLRILARCNQGPETPFAARTGENLVAAVGVTVEPTRRYRLATSDWIARTPKNYFGDDAPALTELTDVRLKPAVVATLEPAGR